MRFSCLPGVGVLLTVSSQAHAEHYSQLPAYATLEKVSRATKCASLEKQDLVRSAVRSSTRSRFLSCTCSGCLRSLRGGAFNWGGSESSSSRRTRGGILGTGSMSPPDETENDVRKRRVETKGPPDLDTRLPPTVPGSTWGRSGDKGSGTGSLGRDRVKTLGPPDSRGRTAESRPGRGGLFGSGSPAVSARRRARAEPQGRWSGSTTGSDPYWPTAGTGSNGAGRYDGEDEGRWARNFGVGSTTMPGGLMAVHYLVLSSFALFSLNTIFRVDAILNLSLDHGQPRWWQPITSLLLHGDQHHLMGNMFNLLIFGKMAEEDMGATGMLASFFACGVVSSLVSMIMMPRAVASCGASGAIFGLYSICVVGKMFPRRDYGSEGRLRKLVEAAVFGWFVVESVISELRMVVAGGVRGTDHAAHFGGVFAGAVLILLARRSITYNAKAGYP